jgi:hypothetical protein
LPSRRIAALHAIHLKGLELLEAFQARPGVWEVVAGEKLRSSILY